ncbi:MAG: riboflavin biosynthesis protein RibD [Syntrophobacterales bacterium CG_4_9_14_3_um_filter_49_8]|nr:MAG: riboflavin biosynthesis protein RibD [Syntrophobacterales bacterium CG_4_9_14_3_um_filter_49_8]
MSDGIEVKVGVLEAECKKLNEFYFKYIQTGMPFVTIKFAQSLDGRIASTTGHSQWISCDASLKLAHRLRGIHDGLMVGIGTVLRDDPRLTVRLAKGVDPCRIIVDSNLKIPLDAKVLTEGDPQRTIIATTEKIDKSKASMVEDLGAQVIEVDENQKGQVDLRMLLQRLGEMKIFSVLVEGGAELLTSFLRANLVDKFVIAIAPKIIGKGIEAVGNLGIKDVSKAIRFSEVKTRKVGTDLIFEGWLSK